MIYKTESACTDSVDNNCNEEPDYDSQDGRHGKEKGLYITITIMIL